MRRVVEDCQGYDCKPDPLAACDRAEFLGALKEYRAWAGEISYRAIAENCGQLVSASTLHRALTGRAMPPFNVVLAVVIGCGGGEEDQRRFATAWRRLRGVGSSGSAAATGRGRGTWPVR